MLFDNAPSSIPFVEQETARLASSTAIAQPSMPTLDEAGVKGYESLSWSGIMAPAARRSA